MSVRINELLRKYSQRDYDALKSIYDFRCLSFNQLFNLHYRFNESGEEVSDGYFRKKIRSFERDNLIEQVDDGKVDPVYFLTTDGVNLTKNAFGFPANIYDYRKHLHRRGYLTSSELRVAPSFVSHQYHLNQFVIDFLDRFPKRHYVYKDEKHIDNYIGIRPDGILRMLDIDFFLEMDMGTEDSTQLTEKWQNYRRFIRSNEFVMKENKIVVLFIVEGVSNIGRRKDLIKRTIYEQIVDIIDKDIEIYVDTKEHLLDIVEKKIFPYETSEYFTQNLLLSILNKNFGFNIFDGNKVAKYFNNEVYEYFIMKDKDYILENNKIQEYLIEDFSYSPHSVIGKIINFENRNSFYYHKFKRYIDMIVLVDDEDFIFNQMMLYDIVYKPRIHYTTLERLSTCPFNEALFNFDENGRRYHYKDSSLKERVYE